MLAKQGGLKPVFDQPLARPGDRVDTGLQSRRDLAVAPARTTLRGVSFQQDAGLQQLLCRMFPAMDKGGELLSFLIAECHDVLLYRDLFSGHEPAPSLVTEASRQKIDVESMTDTTSMYWVENGSPFEGGVDEKRRQNSGRLRRGGRKPRLCLDRPCPGI